MNRTVSIVFNSVVGAVIAAACSGVGAAAPIPSDSDDLTRVVDDTGTIAASVPATWTVDTTPELRSGFQFALIVANAWRSAISLTVSAQVLDENLETSVCAVWWMYGNCEPFDDGNLAGYRTSSEECCAGPGRSSELTANPVNGERVTVQVQLAYDEGQESEAGIFDEIVPTVEVLGSPYPDDWRLSTDALAPPQVPSSQSFWPYVDFYSVPRLGEEPTLGSGCGANGQIGEVIPDGLWAGSVTYLAVDDAWDINLMCVYSGAAADEVLARDDAGVVTGDRDYLVVDNNPRTRSMPNNADGVTATFADVRTDDRCVPGIGQSMPFDNSQVSGSQAWVRIHDGAVTWVLFGCDAGFIGPGG